MSFTPIPEGAAATPQTFNSRFQELDNSISDTFQDAAGFVTGLGNPEGQVSAPSGTFYLDNGQADRLWVKVFGNDATGWRFILFEEV